MVKSLINRDFLYIILPCAYLFHLYIPSSLLLFIHQNTNKFIIAYHLLSQTLTMANHPTITKHNMIANLEKTQKNVDFHGIIDFLTGSSIGYSLFVNPKIIGPWIQEFWATARSDLEEEEDVIHDTVLGRPIRITEATIREILLFDDAEGAVLFDKQVIWDELREIGYEGALNKLTFQKALVSPHWKYLIHVLLHCLSPKSTTWDQFGHTIASALVGLSTNQQFNFSYMILDGMLAHIKAGSPFLMYPRVVQLF
jgi:hypothetical protein